jgi:hypothetical protein
VSGIACVMAADGPYGAATAPLSCQIGIAGGTSSPSDIYNVSGTSGNIYLNGYGVIVLINNGGTPPYGGAGVSVQSDASGKLSIVAAGDGVHNAVGYSGFTLNEAEGCYLQYDITDDAGGSASARYPAAGSLIVKRTS